MLPSAWLIDQIIIPGPTVGTRSSHELVPIMKETVGEDQAGNVEALQLQEESMKVLVATHYFHQLAGSEIVALEIAEEFAARGHSVDFIAVVPGPTMTDLLRAAGVNVLDDAYTVKAFEYDLIWVQNHVACLFDYEATERMAERTCFVFVHLDLKGPLWQVGVVVEPLLADLYLTHSLEARDHFVSSGLPPEMTKVFFNASPPSFWTWKERRSTPQAVGIISNHLSEEVKDAASLLSNEGYTVSLFGVERESVRVTPDLIAQFDVIVSIGKSIQYALANGAVPYVYDHFGGPGYLHSQNFEEASYRNFSGRCGLRKLSGQQIAAEISAGYREARDFVTRERWRLERFKLNSFIDKLVLDARDCTPNAAKTKLLRENRLAMLREKHLVSALAHSTVSQFWLDHERKACLRREQQRIAVDL